MRAVTGRTGTQLAEDAPRQPPLVLGAAFDGEHAAFYNLSTLNPFAPYRMPESDIQPLASPRGRPSWPMLFGILFLVVAARLVFLAVTRISYEDSFISLRYAENLAAGHGLVYNVGERVFGASTPLYVLLLAALVKLGLPALMVVKGLAIAADCATAYLWCRRLCETTGTLAAPLFFAVVFALYPAMVQVGVSGMETSFALLLLTLALQSDFSRKPELGGVWLGLLMLVRPDGALAAAVLLGLQWRRSSQIPLKAASVAGLIVLPWLAWAAWFYGTPLPNSIPAKAAAYNLHRPTIIPNLLDTLALFAPIRGLWMRVLTSLVLFPCLLFGIRAAWRRPETRAVVLLFVVWWLYLVLPKTLLFTWYLPLFLLPGMVVAALGFGELSSREIRWKQLVWQPRWAPGAAAAMACSLCIWLGWLMNSAGQVQRAEEKVRRQIGLWLREHTPAEARVAMEPIGYIGYYSQRRILDEVGLVSPEMVPLNRRGAGWFADMQQKFQPDYIVERPAYLLRNSTINTGVPMFRTSEERDRLLAEYAPVATFRSNDAPERLRRDYEFVIYARRDPEVADARAQRLTAMPEEDRQALLWRELTGDSIRQQTAGKDNPKRLP